MPIYDVVRQSLKFSPVPMLLVSERGEIVVANRELEALFGYVEGDLVGRRVDILVPPEYRSMHGRYIEAFKRVPVARSMGKGRTLMGHGRTGEQIPLELSLEGVDIDGSMHTLVVAVDLRQQVKHQKTMELAVEAAASAMIMSNAEGRIVLTNRAASDLFGFSREEMLGQSVDMLVPEEMRVEHSIFRVNFNHSPVAQMMAKGRMVWGCHKDGHKVPIEIALTPVESPDGDMVMSTVTDLSARLQSEKEIRAKNMELSKLNRDLSAVNSELSQFTYSVSHDLKAPLSSLLGLLRIAREDTLEGLTEEVLSILDRSISLCERHSIKVERVLDFARTQVDHMALASVDLEAMIQEIWDGIAPGAAVPVSLELDLQEPRIESFPVSIESIFQNLLSNAVNYFDPKKSGVEILVASRKVDGQIELSVTDNGVGIPDGKQRKIFEMFQRNDERSGDGIGLALVQKQVHSLRGDIRVESVEGQGSTFTVSIPQGLEGMAA